MLAGARVAHLRSGRSRSCAARLKPGQDGRFRVAHGRRESSPPVPTQHQCIIERNTCTTDPSVLNMCRTIALGIASSNAHIFHLAVHSRWNPACVSLKPGTPEVLYHVLRYIPIGFVLKYLNLFQKLASKCNWNSFRRRTSRRVCASATCAQRTQNLCVLYFLFLRRFDTQ